MSTRSAARNKFKFVHLDLGLARAAKLLRLFLSTSESDYTFTLLFDLRRITKAFEEFFEKKKLSQ
jgi:hypothetical protein